MQDIRPERGEDSTEMPLFHLEFFAINFIEILPVGQAGRKVYKIRHYFTPPNSFLAASLCALLVSLGVATGTW